MAYADEIATHITAMVNELPTVDLRIEVAEAAAFAFQWETWRQSQDPPPADTQANRITFAKTMWAKQIESQVVRWIAAYRRRGEDVAAEIA